MIILESIGETFYYWLVEDINYTDGYLLEVANLKASVISTQTGKKQDIYFNEESSLKDILLNIQH